MRVAEIQVIQMWALQYASNVCPTTSLRITTAIVAIASHDEGPPPLIFELANRTLEARLQTG